LVWDAAPTWTMAAVQAFPSVDLIRRSLPDMQKNSLEQDAALSHDEQAPVPEKGAESGVLVAGSIAAILASTCCLGPLILVTLGFSGAWIGNLALLEPTALVHRRRAGRVVLCGPTHLPSGWKPVLPERSALCRHRVALTKRSSGVVAALVVVAFAFPYVARFFY